MGLIVLHVWILYLQERGHFTSERAYIYVLSFHFCIFLLLFLVCHYGPCNLCHIQQLINFASNDKDVCQSMLMVPH